MILTIILTLFVLSLILGLVEIFLLPGFGVCGIVGVVCAMVGVGVVFGCYGVAYGLLAALSVVVVGCLLLYWVMHSKRIERLSLHARIDSSVANESLDVVKVGDRGVALTRLALVGNARIGGVECEVRSAAGFIEEGTPIEVTKLRLNEVYVKPVSD
ncbi:MAG: NfeD family protein [Bacteroidaceae bacterium]